MRRLFSLFALGLASSLPAFAQYCTGTCQIPPACTQGRTSISGTVYAPNGTDPLPNVTVYIAGDTVAAMPVGVSCPVPGAVPSGSPVAGTTTATDGTFTINDVPTNPAGSPQALVMIIGKWRRIIPIDLSAGACANTVIDPTQSRMPQNSTEGDIPKIAIVTGNADPVECVLYKMKLSKSEFTDQSGGGRINFFLGEGTNPGAAIDAATPSASTLMGDATNLANYDVLMLPCEGSPNNVSTHTPEFGNLVSFANAGGRVYASHYSEDWLANNPAFSGTADWNGNNTTPSVGTTDTEPATINTSFADGSTLSQWLVDVGASTTPGQIAIGGLHVYATAVVSPTQSWLTLNNDSRVGSPPMQFTFDTPVGQATGQCGRVLYNQYHVETSSGTSNGTIFPSVCDTSGVMTPQEKLLEYMLFNLTSDGGDPTLTPAKADFGNEPIGFTSGSQTFTWTNKSIFSSAVTLLQTTGDFVVGPNGCTSVAPGASCQISVAFAPTALGPRTGTLIVGGGGKTLNAVLTGIGVPGLTVSTTALAFPSVDVTGSATQSFQLTNSATGPIPVPALSASGDYTAAGANCGSSLAAGASCTVNVTFRPTSTGPRSGSLAFNSTYTSSVIALTGNGVDFALALSYNSGTVISGRSITTDLLPTPIAGYGSAVSLSCSTTTPGTTCFLSTGSLVPAAGASATVTMTTTSQYTVIGYGSLGGRGLLALLALGSLWWMRRRAGGSRALRNAFLAVLLLAATSLTLTGCGNLTPAQNSTFTGPGSYTFTVTATDGTLTHSTTYTLKVTQN